MSIARRDSFEVINVEAKKDPYERLSQLAVNERPVPLSCQFCGKRVALVLKLTKQIMLTLSNGVKLPRAQVDDLAFCRDCAMNAGLKLLDAHDGG